MKHSRPSIKRCLSFLTLAALAAASPTLFAAEVTGKVKLKGEPKPEVKIPLESTTCGPIVHVPITTRHYVVGADKGLANVFVYIKKGAKPTPAPAGAKVLLDQVNCQYEPYVMGMVVNQMLQIRNSDPILHNVHATPKINKDEFNFAQTTKGQINEKTFDKPEVLVRMMCNVHNWMFAYIGVLDHPYYSVTDKDGSFKISGLPAGTYTVEAYHLKAGRKEQEITVGAGDTKAINFELEVPAAPPQ
jgi:hypothetical protein